MLREKHCVISLLMYGAVTLAGCTQARQLVQRVNPETKHKVETMLTLARAHESEGELKQAEQQYRDILKLDPENGAACHRLGVVMMNQGEADEGLLYLEQANLLLPDDADVVADLGYAYMDAGQIEQAMPLLQAAYDKNPDDKRVINNLAQALGYSGEYDRSLAMFRQIMSEAEATANLAYIYAQTGNGPKAMELYSRALDVDPDLRPAAEALVQLAEMKQEFESTRPASVEWASRQTSTPPESDEPQAERQEIQLTEGRE